MKTLLALIITLTSFAVHAQVPESKWKLVPVQDFNRRGFPVVGYVYHTAATGYESMRGVSINKATELRLICSTKGKPNPIVAIFWEGQDTQVNLLQPITIKVDRKELVNVQSYEWVQEGPLTYRKYEESTELVDAMKAGHMISFEWPGYHTIFSLTGFSTYLTDFSKSCGL